MADGGSRRLARPHLVVLAAVVLAAALLRFAGIGSQSFWYDEWLTLGRVQQQLIPMVRSLPTVGEATPPLYFVAVWFWSKLFGSSEAGLRTLSALLGTATVPVVYLAGATLARSKRIGLVAAALVALNPLLIWYSREARSYALLVFLAVLSFFLFARALECPSRRRLLAWGMVSGLALTAHYFAIFLIAPEAAWLLAAARSRAWDVALAVAPVAAVSVGLLPLLSEQREAAGVDWVGMLPLAPRIGDVGEHFMLGLAVPNDRLWIVGLALVVLAAGLVVARAGRWERHAAAVAGALGGAVVAVPLVLALAGTDYLLSRNVIAAVPLLSICAAAGFGARAAGRLGLIGAAALAALFTAVLLSSVGDADLQKVNWRAAGRAIGAAGPGRLVVAPGGLSAQPLLHYLPGAQGPSPTVSVREIDLLAFRQPSRLSGCWSGIACSVVSAGPPPRRLAFGFEPDSQRRIGLFTLARYRSKDLEQVNVDTLLVRTAALGWTSQYPLFQPPAPGFAARPLRVGR
jgi:mannosyltransferase